jgi:alpha-D-ribose 1-methylphosphonate 5-triphosphate synthase subunit PhnG
MSRHYAAWMNAEVDPVSARRRWMSILARASSRSLETFLANAPSLPQHRLLRGPEVGLVMVRGRAGGDGAPFNFGEMTVTRCSVQLANGQIGHAYSAGRDLRQAELAALCDAALQDPAYTHAVLTRVVEPLAAAQAAERQAVAAKAAATRVEFLSMQTMR